MMGKADCGGLLCPEMCTYTVLGGVRWNTSTDITTTDLTTLKLANEWVPPHPLSWKKKEETSICIWKPPLMSLPCCRPDSLLSSSGIGPWWWRLGDKETLDRKGDWARSSSLKPAAGVLHNSDECMWVHFLHFILPEIAVVSDIFFLKVSSLCWLYLTVLYDDLCWGGKELWRDIRKSKVATSGADFGCHEEAVVNAWLACYDVVFLLSGRWRDTCGIFCLGY